MDAHTEGQITERTLAENINEVPNSASDIHARLQDYGFGGLRAQSVEPSAPDVQS